MSVRRVRLPAVLAALVLAAGVTVATTSTSAAHQATHQATHQEVAAGRLAIVQAVPGSTLTVTVDGKQIKSGVAVGDVVGPLELTAGQHEVVFADEGGPLASATTVDVTAGKTADVVVHRPAAVGGRPVVTVYPTPLGPIGPGKARVLLAHTATTAPADVQVDGQVVFTNIANGEYAQADVPAGSHSVALLPSGLEAKPILGPIDVTLEAGTITEVFAVGNPVDGSMNVIVQTGSLEGIDSPTQIDTGFAGLVADVRVNPFHTQPRR